MATDDLTIVLADDQDLVRAGFRVILESEPGFRVVGEARDGAEAVDTVLAQRPDVVCLDVQMPNVDGLDCLGAVRRLADDAEPGLGLEDDAEACPDEVLVVREHDRQVVGSHARTR